jgi:hypothetical protein
MSDSADKSAEKQRGVPFTKDDPRRNLKGRPKGSRSKLGEAFIEALHDDFSENGVEAIQKLRAADPGGYVRVVAGLLPKELKIETTSDLTDEQLDARIRQLASALEIGISEPPDGAAKAEGPHAASGVSTLQ